MTNLKINLPFVLITDLITKFPLVSIDLTMDDVINNQMGLILTDDQVKGFVKKESREICWNAKVSVRPEFVTKPIEESKVSGAILKCMTALLSLVLVLKVCNNLLTTTTTTTMTTTTATPPSCNPNAGELVFPFL